MKSRNLISAVLIVIFAALSLKIYVSSLKIKELRVFKDLFIKSQRPFNARELEAKTDFIADIMPIYDTFLSTESSFIYSNARKDPSKYETVKFCVVVPSYNNVKYTTQNINSVLMQDYHNWRMIFLDDASNDGTSDIVSKMKEDSGLSDDKFKVERYSERKRRASFSFYHAAHTFCKDDEVLVMLDGDDMLATPNVLKRLYEVYKSGKYWLTYGHHMFIHTAQMCPITREATSCEWGNLRDNGWWGYSHLRTAYTWLFKKIKKEDLMYNGDFMTVSWDMAIMYPMLEMAGKDRSKYVNDITYLYRSHPANDSKLFFKEQKEVENYIKDLKPYKLLEEDKDLIKDIINLINN